MLLTLLTTYDAYCSETHIEMYDAIIKALTFTTGMLLVFQPQEMQLVQHR